MAWYERRVMFQSLSRAGARPRKPLLSKNKTVYTNGHRVAVIVLGMHRSGTSAVTGAAIRLGMAPPRTPLAPTEENPNGFHEPAPLVDLNHLFLGAIGCNWYNCLSLTPDMLDADARAAAFDKCTEVLRQEFDEAPAFVVKDPLLCLTLPLWLPALRAVGAAVSVLLVARHPEEVARSLFHRDMLPEATSVVVWLHHMLEAERMTRDLPRAMVLYDDLLHDWRGCMARAAAIAGFTWPKPIDPFASNDDGGVVRSLRHHTTAANAVTVGPPAIRDLIDEAWVAFRHLRDNPALPIVQARLNQVRARFAVQRASFPATQTDQRRVG